MEGGALLGQGTYGCVFDRPLLCNDGRRYKGVGKVGEAVDANKEIEAAKYLSKIPGASTYFVLANTSSVCKPASVEKQSDRDGIKRCEIIEHDGLNGLIQYTMPYGGVSISKYRESKMKLNFPAFTKRLLEIGATLALNSFVHYDLHSGNILIKNGTPVVIDFGASFSVNSISDALINGDSINYPIWKKDSIAWDTECPEVTCATVIRKDRTIFQDTILQIINKRPILRSAEVVLGLSRRSQLNSFIKFWNSSISAQKMDWPTYFKTYWSTFDSWSIGVVLLKMYIETHGKYVSIKGVLRGLLLIDPRRRLDCVEALAQLDPENEIVNSPSGIAWLAEKEKIRASIGT